MVGAGLLSTRAPGHGAAADRDVAMAGLAPPPLNLGEQLRLVLLFGHRKGKIKPLKYPALFPKSADVVVNATRVRIRRKRWAFDHARPTQLAVWAPQGAGSS